MDSINIQICLTQPSLSWSTLCTPCQVLSAFVLQAVQECCCYQYPTCHIQEYDEPVKLLFEFLILLKKKLVIIEKLPRAKQSGNRWKKVPEGAKGHKDFLPVQRQLVNIHPILLSFYFLFNQEARGDGKIVTFNEYVKALIQVSPLSFVETHFYSWSQSSAVMTLHTYVSFVKLRGNGN